MTNLISRTFARIGFLLKELQVKRFLAAVLVGFLVLTTNIAFGQNTEALTNKIDRTAHQDGSDRPKTSREWNQEARQTEDAPGERIERIGKESAEAFQEFGSGYVEGAKNTADRVKDGAAEAGKDLSDTVQR